MKIILASSSPRRKELLKNMGVSFETMISDEKENILQNKNYKYLSKFLSNQKAENVLKNVIGDCTIIGSDTMVVFKGEKLGKPKDEQDARKMIKQISEKHHKVVTGLCVIIRRNGEIKKIITCSVTSVKVSKLSKLDEDWYISTKDWVDKAGAYGVQGYFGKFIEKIKGDYYTVVGLPCNKLYKILRKENII